MEICPQNVCTACGACANACPKGCISWIKDDLDSFYPSINEDICVHCDVCRRSCPNNNALEFHRPFRTFAAWSLDPANRHTSASGGITSVFYRYALKKGGFTCGVELKLDTGVGYIPIVCEDDILRVKNSKYVFSHTNSIYQQVKQALRDDKFVFFVGLPCQVAGLKTYLGKMADNENLLLADIICHGISNEEYLFQYIHHIEKKKHHKADTLFFRDPVYGTESYSFTLRDKESVFYNNNHYDTNLYFIGYMEELHYRENCYHCRYAKAERITDLTFGDFDGLGKYIPFNHPKKQVSMCLVNTEKGYRYLKEVSEDLFLEERTFEEAYKPQRQLKHPSKGHPKRGQFLQDYRDTHDFTYSARKALARDVRTNRVKKIYSTLIVKPLLGITSKEHRDRVKRFFKR